MAAFNSISPTRELLGRDFEQVFDLCGSVLRKGLNGNIGVRIEWGDMHAGIPQTTFSDDSDVPLADDHDRRQR